MGLDPFLPVHTPQMALIFNPLGSCDESYASFDPITGGVEQGFAVKVYKA